MLLHCHDDRVIIVVLVLIKVLKMTSVRHFNTIALNIA